MADKEYRRGGDSEDEEEEEIDDTVSLTRNFHAIRR